MALITMELTFIIIGEGSCALSTSSIKQIYLKVAHAYLNQDSALAVLVVAAQLRGIAVKKERNQYDV